MRKLTSFTKGGGQLHLNGFSALPPIVVLKGSKLHASICEQSADKLDNLSCVISVSGNMSSKSHILYNVFPLKSVMSSMW